MGHLLALRGFVGKIKNLVFEFFDLTDQFLSLLVPKKRHGPLPLSLHFFFVFAAHDLHLFLRVVDAFLQTFLALLAPFQLVGEFLDPFLGEFFAIYFLAFEAGNYPVKLTEGLATGMIHDAAFKTLLPTSLALVFQLLTNFLQLLYLLLPCPQGVVSLCLILVSKFQL